MYKSRDGHGPDYLIRALSGDYHAVHGCARLYYGKRSDIYRTREWAGENGRLRGGTRLKSVSVGYLTPVHSRGHLPFRGVVRLPFVTAARGEAVPEEGVGESPDEHEHAENQD